jgi:hypothetical protein
MPVSGPGGYNTGKDTTLDISTSSGLLRITNITGFQAKQLTHKLESKPLDGRILFAELPAGWEGTFTVERASSSLDDYIAQQEANYFGGLNSDTITITETNAEVNGSVTQYRYTGVCLYMEDAGERMQDQVVKMKLSFKASRRVKIA